MSDRFYCPDLTGDSATLDDAESHHAAHVMRVSAGDHVTLFDGMGTTAEACVSEVRRRTVRMNILKRTQHKKPPASVNITVAAAIPKGDRLKWMIEKLTEIGVDRFVPLTCERSVVDPRTTKLQKLTSTIVSASKQCGRNWLMQMTEPVSFPILLDISRDADEAVTVAHPATASCLQPNVADETQRQTLLIGPEGGFTESEIQLAENQKPRFLSWPEGILRTETAAVVFASLLINKEAQTACRCQQTVHQCSTVRYLDNRNLLLSIANFFNDICSPSVASPVADSKASNDVSLRVSAFTRSEINSRWASTTGPKV